VRWLAGLLAAAVLAGCGGGDDRPAPPAPQLDPPGATEPALAPVPDETPPGRIVELGARPEGVAVDVQSRTAAVAVRKPNRLLLIDSATGAVRREVALPGTARHVSVAGPGGPFLVGAESADALVEVDPRSGAKRVTAVGDFPHDATAVGERIFTADEFGSTMSVVRDGRRVGQVPVDAQPGNVVAVGDRVAVISVRAYTVELYDATSDEPRGLGSQSAGLGPSHAVPGPDGQLVIGDTRGRALMVYDTEPQLRFRARVELDGTPVGLAADPDRGRVWVALSERNQAVPVDLRGEQPELGPPVATVRNPFSLAVEPATGRLLIASQSEGTLQLVTPAPPG